MQCLALINYGKLSNEKSWENQAGLPVFYEGFSLFLNLGNDPLWI